MNGGKRLSSVVSGGVRAGAMGTATALALLLSLSGGVLSMPAPAFARAVAADEKLPTDPALVTGTLENGLSYVVRKHANPAGRVSVWIHVSSGSLNEVEETRGMAHYLEHMAFNGSANFPPGKVVDFFQSLGLQFGRDQNAFTSFDQTTYQLALPDAKPETIEKAMLFFSDVAGRLLLNEKEIESERGIIIEERRTRLSAQQRVQDYIIERVAPESTFGRRLPIGTEATIMGVQKPAFEEYYRKFYVPSNMTLIVVGDVDADTVRPLIQKHFGEFAKVPRPADLPVGVTPTRGVRAIVATDAELTDASISLNRVDAPRPPTTTRAQFRDDLVEQIGSWAFGRRVTNELAKGTPRFLSASASSSTVASTLNWTSVSADGKPENWKEMLKDVATLVQRARLHGFRESELKDATTELLAQAEEAVKRESTLPARVHLQRMNGAIAEGEPIMSAQQRLDLLRELLPTIKVSEISARFKELYDPTNAIFIAELPLSAGVPSEAELIKLGTEAFSVQPAPDAEEARATALLAREPVAGKVAEVAMDQASGVSSGWLSNGVRMHHRFMDNRKNTATITITLASGEIVEAPGQRGTASAASIALIQPASSTLTSTQIRDLMTGNKASARGGVGGDRISINISGSPEGFEKAFQLAHLMITDPKVEPAALELWRSAQLQAIAQRKSVPEGVLAEIAADSIFPKGDDRNRPLTEEQVKAVKLDQVQAWLTGALASAPIEVSIVGDVQLEDVKPLIEKYIGSLSTRERISDKTLAEKRKIQRPAGPLVSEKTIATKTPQARALDGFFGPDLQNVKDVRLMQLASRIISTRMIKILREEKRLVYSIDARSSPGTEYPGFGLFAAQAPTNPESAEALAVAIEEIYADFAKNGPTQEELDTARLQLLTVLDETMKEPEFWINRLSTLTYRGQKLEDILGAADFYKGVTADMVRTAFATYFKPEARMRFIVKPEAAPAAPAKPAGT